MATIQLCEDTTKKLTDQAWQRCQDSRMLTYLEVQNLTVYFLKMCREQNRDPREFDYVNLIDSNLNYYENRAALENELGGLNIEEETKASNILKDYLTEEQLAEYTPQQKNIIEGIENTTKTLQKKLGQIVKKMDEQTIDPEALRHELDEMQKVQSQIYARLEQIPNLPQLVAALEKSQNFKLLAEAIKPITPNMPASPPEPQTKRSRLSFLHPKREIPLLDKIALAAATTLWAGLTYGAFTSWGINWASLVEMALFWVFYPVAIRIIAGGILD